MTVYIDIKVKGTEKVQAKMDLMFVRSKSFEPIFIKAKKQLELSNAANFSAQGLPAGGWAPLDPQYAAWKAVRFPGKPIMVANGKLFRSVTNMTSGISSISFNLYSSLRAENMSCTCARGAIYQSFPVWGFPHERTSSRVARWIGPRE